MVQIKIVPSKPALMIDGDTRNLVVTDIHIGFETKLISNEIFVGKNTATNETINELEGIIDDTKPDSLILLGDIKSSIKTISKNEWNDVPLFFEKIKNKVDVIIVPGNHDANIQKLIPTGITVASQKGMVIENVLFTHGHSLPTENISHIDKIIMGHVHPVFFHNDSVVSGQRVWVSIKCEKQNIFPSAYGEIEITIIPSFNKYFYSTHKKNYKKSISPIIEKVKKITSARIVTLDGSIIGDESVLSHVI